MVSGEDIGVWWCVVRRGRSLKHIGIAHARVAVVIVERPHVGSPNYCRGGGSFSLSTGDKFFTRVNGVRRATPLLLCVVCIELSDFVFAVDSIPAVLSVSKDQFIVLTSNVFAIMALRRWVHGCVGRVRL